MLITTDLWPDVFIAACVILCAYISVPIYSDKSPVYHLKKNTYAKRKKNAIIKNFDKTADHVKRVKQHFIQ